MSQDKKQQEKQWRDSDFDCPECGATAQTDSTAPDHEYHDGDNLKCPDCGNEGQVITDDDEEAPYVWDCWS